MKNGKEVDLDFFFLEWYQSARKLVGIKIIGTISYPMIPGKLQRI